MLWVKVLHLLFVIGAMAGIFYLPRIFVHYVEGREAGEEVRRLAVMARKLYLFTNVIGTLALATGFWLWLGYGIGGGWLHAKLTLVTLLAVYHLVWARRQVMRMQAGATLPGSSGFYRGMNEVPLLLLVGILVLVVVKPF